ncbi:MAG: hypothetical protein GXP35_06215 [Actinobacteria bacterium]|nr:hypothetical protein [Actinomycetota bacterium]
MTRFTRRRLSHPIIGVLLLLAVVASACNEIPAEPITIDNQSDQTIIIVRSFSESVFMEILPGRTGVDPSTCVDPDLEARLENGAVVASRPGPFCQGDPVWVITQAEVDAAQ